MQVGDPRHLPKLATEYIVLGIESEPLNRLAGVDLFKAIDPCDCYDHFIKFLEESNHQRIQDETKQALLISSLYAKCHANSLYTPEQITNRFYKLVVNLGYNWPLDEIGELYAIDDEWLGGWGRSPEQLTKEVDKACDKILELTKPKSESLNRSMTKRLAQILH